MKKNTNEKEPARIFADEILSHLRKMVGTEDWDIRISESLTVRDMVNEITIGENLKPTSEYEYIAMTDYYKIMAALDMVIGERSMLKRGLWSVRFMWRFVKLCKFICKISDKID